jgi:16S rRNA processing protein RimM
LSGSGEANQRWVQIASILRPRGNKGEVAAVLLTDFPARLSSLTKVYLAKGQQEPQPVALQRFWMDQNHPGQGVFHFAGSTNISEAEKFRGNDVFLPLEERVRLPVGQYFVTDLIGCTVFEMPEAESKLSSPACAADSVPRVVGTVRDVAFPGEGVAGTPLLQVDSAQGELLIPLAEDICTRIDVAARRIEARLPEGLLSVNTAEWSQR